MRNSTLDNYTKRKEWLDDVTSHKIKVSQNLIPLLATARDFCSLSIPNRFKQISYNTLKSAAQHIDLKQRNNLNEEWPELLRTLTQARNVADPALSQIPKKPLPPSDELLSRTLLEAHICSLGYLELFSFLSKLLSQNPPLPEVHRALIEHQLAISGAKFKKIISFSDQYTAKSSKLYPVDPA